MTLDAEALALLAKHQHGDIKNVADQPVAVLSAGVRVESLRPILDSYLERPARATGFDALDDAVSFVAHVNRHKHAHSVLFAALAPPSTATFRAVYDYHSPETAGGDGGQPRHGEHGAVYHALLSEEYQAWAKFAAQGFVAPTEFAEFLEARVMDVVPDPKASDALTALQELLGGTWATPIKLVELSRGLQVNVAETVKQASSLSTGEIQVTYNAQHNDTAGAPLRVPSLFAIGIPILRHGERYQIAVRLRYRIRNGALTWAIAPHRMDAAWQDAVDTLGEQIATATQLPLFRGVPA